jgi:hypothetical protein
MDIISLSKAVRLKNNASYSTTFISRYTNRTDHLDKSLHQYFHIVKNNSSDEPKKKFIPHYVGGGGQPSYPISIIFARTEMIKHIPWHKNNPLPATLTLANYIKLFNNFKESRYCPASVPIAIERAQNRVQNYQKGIKEPISEETIESQPLDNDTQDLLKTSTNLRETINIFEKLEQQGLDIGKQY